MAQTFTSAARPRRINPQRLAWGVMLLSFAVFCAIVVVIILGIQYFLFQSRVSMQASLNVARGTATVIGSDLVQQAERGNRDISDGGVITTDPQSQASISVIDFQRSDQLIATITVKNGSSLDLEQDSRPRFDWSNDPYWIDMDQAYGSFDVYVPENLDRPILISMETTLGPSARLTASGRYTIVAAGNQVQMVNYSGSALLIAPDLHNQLIAAGQTGSIQMGEPTDQFTLVPASTNPLGDSGFASSNVLDMNTPAAGDGQVWRCYSSVADPNESAGTFDVTDVDGRPAVRLFRDGGAVSHGATTCLQGLGTSASGLDVSNYSSISIRATFKIQSQSLSTCGVDASECPFTLAMDYVPVNGGQPTTWYHGFYAFVDPNRPFPTQCNSCSEQHEQINPGVWYTYESANLKTTFAPQSVPQVIINLRFYASGHEYDVYVRNVEIRLSP